MRLEILKTVTYGLERGRNLASCISNVHIVHMKKINFPQYI